MFPSAPKKLGANCQTFRDQPPPETLAPSVPLNVSGPGVVGQGFISCHHANLVAKTRFHLCLQHSKSKEKLQIVSQNHWNSQMRLAPPPPGAETRKGGLVLSKLVGHANCAMRELSGRSMHSLVAKGWFDQIPVSFW